MSMTPTHPLPTIQRLLRATVLALVVATIILITTVLPAEYGIDPTGVGARLGLTVLSSSAQAAEPPATPAPIQKITEPAVAKLSLEVAAEAAKSADIFGASPGQTFDLQAVRRVDVQYRRDTMTVLLPPGKGAEIKATVKAGDSFVFHWTATADVAVDMHGDRLGAKDAWTSYWIERAQHQGSGLFIAPFNGNHGWYWLNRGATPVTVNVEVSGFQEKLFRPGH